MKTKHSRPHDADESAWLADVKSCYCVFCDAPPPVEAHHPRQGNHFQTVSACKSCHDARVWRIGGLSEQDAINETVRRVVRLRAGNTAIAPLPSKSRQHSTRTPIKRSDRKRGNSTRSTDKNVPNPPRPARAVTTPAARKSDPVSSHQSAEQHTRSGARAHQQRQVIAAVRAFPGRTSFELAMASDIDRYVVARRLPECETAGAVKRGATKHCLISGRSALTWSPA